jgi:hypothetical protein
VIEKLSKRCRTAQPEGWGTFQVAFAATGRLDLKVRQASGWWIIHTKLQRACRSARESLYSVGGIFRDPIAPSVDQV